LVRLTHGETLARTHDSGLVLLTLFISLSRLSLGIREPDTFRKAFTRILRSSILEALPRVEVLDLVIESLGYNLILSFKLHS